jgi:histidine triad (HIT) family protein
MIIPKKHIASLAEATPADAPVLGKALAIAGRLAHEQGSTEGFRTIVNTGEVGRQDVYHLHIHIIGGPNPLPRMLAKE